MQEMLLSSPKFWKLIQDCIEDASFVGRVPRPYCFGGVDAVFRRVEGIDVIPSHATAPDGAFYKSLV